MQRRKQRGKVDLAIEAAVEAVTGNVLAASRLKRLMKALTPEQRLAVLKNVAERLVALEREVRAAIPRIDVKQ
jgi:glucose-6-phosphate-specific signal transduction histidine kinase